MVCDFQAIYRVRIDPDTGDLAGLSGPQFFRLASRLPAYDGAVSAQVARVRAEQDSPAQPSPGAAAPAGQHVDATPLNLTTSPLLRQFVDYSQAPTGAPEAG